MSATYLWRVVCFCFHPHSAERGIAVESTDYPVSPVDPPGAATGCQGVVRMQQIRVGDRDRGSGSSPGTGLMQLKPSFSVSGATTDGLEAAVSRLSPDPLSAR